MTVCHTNLCGKTRRAWVDAARLSVPRWLAAPVIAGAALLLPALPAHAQDIPCLPVGQDLIRIPELVRIPDPVASQPGKLRGTLVLSDEQQRLPLKISGSVKCFPQYVRTFRGVGAVPEVPRGYPDPVPGPTLRARVGDLVELTFLSQINPNNFGNSIDRGDNAGACDEFSAGGGTQGYPQSAADAFPDCFHGSSTGNIHFHGTHTNPNSTGDNVFLQIRPSPRPPNGNGPPSVAAASVKDSFDKFFADCENHLKSDVLSEWPTAWTDLPQAWRDDQQKLLQAYDMNKPDAQKLWPADAAQLAHGQWPQFYIGAYPYCFRLPEDTSRGWPPAPGAGLKMGQSPGTHWYHAHKHGSTAINVSNGMTGAFIIEGKYDDDLNAFYGMIGTQPWTRAQPVIVINQLGVNPNLVRNRGGGAQNFSVNGQMQPVLNMKPGEVQLWRIVNTSSRSGVFFVGPPAGFEWMQLAQDGVQFWDSNYQKSLNESILVAAGNRIDLLVKAASTVQTQPFPIMVRPAVNKGQTLPPTPPKPDSAVVLMSVKVSGAAPENPHQTEFIKRAPTPPAFLADITDQEIRGTKTIVFNSKAPGLAEQHTIDGKVFSDEIGASVLLNTAEEWKVVNTTNATTGPGLIDHPFHIHINPFQIVELFDPNELLVDAKGQPLVDPATKKPAVDASGNPLPKYVFDRAAVQSKDLQCFIDPRGNPANWKPCDDPWGKQTNLIWWDVFPIPSGKVATDAKGNQLKDFYGQPIIIPGYFKMRSRFVDFPGLYVMHCHILAHEDRGMMAIVQVTPAKPQVTHH